MEPLQTRFYTEKESGRTLEVVATRLSPHTHKIRGEKGIEYIRHSEMIEKIKAGEIQPLLYKHRK